MIEDLLLLGVQQLRSKTVAHILNGLPELRSLAINLWDAVDDSLIQLLLNRKKTPFLDALSLCFKTQKDMTKSEL